MITYTSSSVPFFNSKFETAIFKKKKNLPWFEKHLVTILTIKRKIVSVSNNNMVISMSWYHKYTCSYNVWEMLLLPLLPYLHLVPQRKLLFKNFKLQTRIHLNMNVIHLLLQIKNKTCRMITFLVLHHT